MRRSRALSARRRRRALLGLLAVLLLGVALLALESFFTPDVVARVLFAETANCDTHERALVAGVMRNRIGQAAFGGLMSLQAVVRQPGAFSSLGDSANTNWAKSRQPGRMTAAEQAVWQECRILAQQPPAPCGPSGRPLVYFHDRSIGPPPGWTNRHWRAVREVATPRFVFYSVVPAGR